MGWSDEGWGTKKQAAAGVSVITYPSVSDLITASEGGLAPGYYEVLTVPTTHPQYPRVLTYWDGATFEPQISTGFESRPTLAGEIYAWDALESEFRNPKTDDTRLLHVPDLLGVGDLRVVQPSANIAPFWRDGAVSVEEFGQRIWRDGSPAAYNSGSLIMAGRFLPLTTNPNQVIACAGSTSANLGIAIFTHVAGAGSKWTVGWWGGSNTGAFIRGSGDVAILSWDNTSYDFWVNGVKMLTQSGLSLNITPQWIMIGGDYSIVYTTSGSQFDFAEFSTTRLGDTAAAEWTAWLQDRYSIPVL